MVAELDVALDGVAMSVTISVGGAVAAAGTVERADPLIARADAGLYDARRTGRNRYARRPAKRGATAGAEPTTAALLNRRRQPRNAAQVTLRAGRRDAARDPSAPQYFLTDEFGWTVVLACLAIVAMQATRLSLTRRSPCQQAMPAPLEAAEGDALRIDHK